MKFRTLLPIALLLLAVPALRGEILEQILVKVNGDIFTKSDLEQRQIAALRQKGQAIDLKSDPNNAQLRKALDEITPQIMVDAIDEMVISRLLPRPPKELPVSRPPSARKNRPSASR